MRKAVGAVLVVAAVAWTVLLILSLFYGRPGEKTKQNAASQRLQKSQRTIPQRTAVTLSFETEEVPEAAGRLRSGARIYLFTRPLKVRSDYPVGYTYSPTVEDFEKVARGAKMVEGGKQILLEKPGLYYLTLFSYGADGEVDGSKINRRFLIVVGEELPSGELDELFPGLQRI